MDVKKVKAKDLEEFMISALKASGVPGKDAKIVSEVLITADKLGIDTHGINRLNPIYLKRIESGILNPVTKVKKVVDKRAVAVLDGNNGFGHVVSYKAMKLAIKKAKKYGISMVAVKNSTHYGIAGFYPLMAVNEGMLGITGTNARPSIAPTFGVENMLGTNPLTFGFPTDDEFPFLLDCATSICQRGKIELYARESKELPENWVIGRDGKSHRDSKIVLEELVKGEAALAPLGGIGEDSGGYKGYGYATVVEILSAALQGGKYLRDLSGKDRDGNLIPYPLGHFFIVINPESFMGLNLFKYITSGILKDLRESQKAPGEERIYTAGEKEGIFKRDREVGGIPISVSLEKEIESISEKYGVKNPLKN